MSETVKPSCSLTIRDGSGWAEIYGDFFTGLSSLSVDINYESGGADLAGCEAKLILPNDTSATGIPLIWSLVPRDLTTRYLVPTHFTTDVLRYAGDASVIAYVTDTTGAVSEAIVETVSVKAYAAPVISKLSVHRCQEDGTEDIQGAYVQVTFSVSVTTLNYHNTATYTLAYKKGSATEWTQVALDDLEDNFAVTDYTYIFPAEVGSAYNVRLTVMDDHRTSVKTTSASTGIVLMHFNDNGTAIGIGKVSTREKAVEFGLPIYSDKLILSSPTGKLFQLAVDDSGTLTATEWRETLSAPTITIEETS